MSNSGLPHDFPNHVLGLDDTFHFRCTQCGKCCKQREDILVSPYDLFRISRHFSISPQTAVERYCIAYIGSTSRMPLLILKACGKERVCPFLDKNRCSIHRSKPTVCALFPLGRAANTSADAAVGYHEGVELHLPSFAKKLIEEPSGWYVHPRKSEGESIPLSVNCHSFDLNTLWFEADCTWEEVDRRRKTRAQEKIDHNTSLEMQLLSYDEVCVKTADSKVYDVRRIEMNHNASRYEIRESMMLRHELIYDGRLNRDVIDIEVHPINSGDLFEVECPADLVLNDPRIIPTDNQPVVTGQALAELLSDADTAKRINAIRIRRQTLAEFRHSLERWRDG